MPAPNRLNSATAIQASDQETSEKLIAAAERLFAQHGYGGVSVRMIAATAGVNCSLLGYYFRGKEGLLSEVYRRHCGELNSARMRLLQEIRAGGRQPKLEEILNAFIRPALAVARGEDGQTDFIRLRAILTAENSALFDKLVAENFDVSSTIFIDALRECLPQLTRDDILWRFHFMLGTIYYTASGPHRIKEFSNGRCDPADIEANLGQLLPFLAAAFRAPSVKPVRRKSTDENARPVRRSFRSLRREREVGERPRTSELALSSKLPASSHHVELGRVRRPGRKTTPGKPRKPAQAVPLSSSRTEQES
jgi:AcrR family transcriptional regulator